MRKNASLLTCSIKSMTIRIMRHGTYCTPMMRLALPVILVLLVGTTILTIRPRGVVEKYRAAVAVVEIKSPSGSASNSVGFSSKPDPNIFSPEELNYFDTGIGNKTKLHPRLPAYIRKRIADPLDYKPANEWVRKDFSQFGQSAEVDKLLNNRNNGFFVECGAHDGLEASNTAYLELARNWSGLLMEGDPAVYPKMLMSKRKTYMLPHCISPVDQPFRANFRIAGGFQGLSDFFRLHKEPDKNSLRETLVTCFPFNSIMEALGITHVDFFSLDVEGAELEVLQTIDFNKIRIDLLLIEYAYTPLESKQKESNERLEKYRALFNATGLYKEVAILNFPGINLGLDVAFRRIDFK